MVYFYNMKNILITGACGFIGSNFAEKCVDEGYNVTAFDRYNSTGDLGWLNESTYKDSINFILGDIRDYDSVFKALQGNDIVVHMAALIGIPYSYISPLAYLRTNIEGTYNVLEASKNQNISQTIVTSTSETYGTAQYVPMDEQHPLMGQSPYSASKIAADQLAISYHRSFSSPVKIVRPFNTYGPRQSARAIIPTIFSQILSGSKEINLGSISPTRDFTYVTDTCNAFLEIMKTDLLFGEVVNVGMNDEISIGDLVLLIQSIVDRKIKIISKDERIRPKKSEVNRLYCDNSKLLSSTNWAPKFKLKQGLYEVFSWMKSSDHLNKYNSKIYNV